MSRTVTLAVAQFPAAIGKIAENLNAIERLCAKAAKDGATFILLPEDCVTGYPAESKSAFGVALAQTSDEIGSLTQIATKYKIDIAAGFIERSGEHCHSAHYIARADGSHSVIRKYSVDARDQTIGITPAAPQGSNLEIENVKAALAICMDGTDAFFQTARRDGARIILHPSGGACAKAVRQSDANAEQIDAAERSNCEKCVESARKRARSLNAVYCVANPVGFDGQRGYPGNSFIISPTGELLASLPGTATIEKMQEAVVTAKVSLPAVQ